MGEQWGVLGLICGLWGVIQCPALAGTLVRLALTRQWSWPANSLASSWEILRSGNTTAGHADPPPPVPMPAVILVLAVLWGGLVALAVAVVIWWERRGAGAGFATRAEAEAALGISRLRGSRTQIRPDLYPPGSRRRRRRQQATGGRPGRGQSDDR